MSPFWADGTAFRQLFAQLNTSRLVELACGHGRHSEQVLSGKYCSRPSEFTLLDVNQENVSFCKNRFGVARRLGIFRNSSANRFGPVRLNIWRNSGIDFHPVAADSATAIFSYDSMVHFEFDCIISYVRDAARVLVPGGRALFHHSNYAQPGTQWDQNPHWRNFMSRELLAHAALRAGFGVLNQVVLDWGEGAGRVAAIDCLTLLEKRHQKIPPGIGT
jgi:SAM-dependent methyltransferase